jgi:hypothetical protein
MLTEAFELKLANCQTKIVCLRSKKKNYFIKTNYILKIKFWFYSYLAAMVKSGWSDARVAIRSLMSSDCINEVTIKVNRKWTKFSFFSFLKRFIVPSSMHIQHHYRKKIRNKINL